MAQGVKVYRQRYFGAKPELVAVGSDEKPLTQEDAERLVAAYQETNDGCAYSIDDKN